MSRLNEFILALLVCIHAFGSIARAQENKNPLEQYLIRHSLEDLLAEHLVENLDNAVGTERVEVAQKLANLYVDLLDNAESEADRKYWSDRASNLLRLVPESDSPNLRINLAKAAYIRAERIAESNRLRLASDEERAQAERILRDASATFLAIAQGAHQRSQVLERRLSERLEQEVEAEVSSQLSEARQQRSLGFYYAGWSEYYYALISGDRSHAGRALRHFGWLLSARDGEEASFDRLQPGLLQYDHVARAATGAALACSLLDRHVEAVAWLDAIEANTDAPQEIRDQVYDRRVWVYAKAGMWADLELMIRRTRASGDPLSAITARLLVVGSMESLVGAEGQGRSRELIRRLADIGLKDLINEGEVAHVLELVRVFGTAPLGDTGFIPLYVKGLLALDRAEEAREASGEIGDGPVSDDAVAAFFREAGNLLLASVDEPDAVSHVNERVRAITTAGTAFYLSGDLILAADVLERAIGSARTPEQAEDALWLAVVALEEAVEAGDTSLTPRRDQAAQLYLSTYAGSERSARLLMRPGTAGLVPDSEAVDILISIPPVSANYLAARRQASQLLYRIYRNSAVDQRVFAGERFLDVASQLVRNEQTEVRSGDVDRAKQAADSLVLRARQIADVALGLSPADIERATLALDTLDRVAGYASIDISGIEPEIVYRRLQIAAAEENRELTEIHYQQLALLDGGFLSTAQRLLYRQGVQDWLDDPLDAEAARSVVKYGTAVIDQFSSQEPSSRALLGVLETVAQASGSLWELKRDHEMLETALAMNERLIDSSAGSGPVLKRQAYLLERASREPEALDVWRRLVNGLDPETDAWYEARYESIRLLKELDRPAAVEAMNQHVLLYPGLGPDPWRDRLQMLARSLGVEVGK
ncbi:MAG: hypothetical protein ED559_07150 [Phycisphaera sp.]|nr:MAG: hypothetical protein ED559_07150 [Phycisphaera sp.]